MMSIYKWFVFTIVLLTGLTGISSLAFADEEHLAGPICDDVVFSLVGPESVVVGTEHTYAVSVAILGSAMDGSEGDAIIVPQDILSETIIDYEFAYNSRVLQRVRDQELTISFDQLGNYTVDANVVYQGCTYNLSLSVGSYESIFIYIGPYIDEFAMGISQNMLQNNLFLRPFVLSDDMASSLIPLVRQHWSIFSQADDIYFSLANYSLMFDVLRLMELDPMIDLSSKRIFIIDDMQKSIVKKFLARFTRNLSDISLFVISSQEAMNMFLQFSIGKTDYDDDFLQSSRLQFTGSSWSYSLGYIIDYLLFQGFPLDMLLLILSSVFAVFFIVFAKQVVGISSFGVYYPLLFAVSLRVVGLKTSLFLLIIAFLAKILTIAITRRFTLLATAKLGLQIALYIFLTIVGLVVLSSLGVVSGDFLVFTYPMMLFVYLSLLLIAAKLWTSSSLIPSVKQIVSIGVFLFVAGLSYLIIESDALHRIILLYPGLVIVVVISIVALGRYTGLQLIEFVRFWPLIRHIKSKK